MAKSVFVERLDEVQASIWTLLKPLGFRRKGRAFNRSTEDGLIQVINFQTGQFPLGEPLPEQFAHLRPNLYGKFTINLGVHIREVWQQDRHPTYPTFLQDYHCQIRQRLGSKDWRDNWWSLEKAPSAVAEEVAPLLLTEGVDFLEQFGSRSLILRDWIAYCDGLARKANRARVDVAIMLAHRGDKAGAVRLFNEQISRPTNDGHKEYVRGLALNLDLGQLESSQ